MLLLEAFRLRPSAPRVIAAPDPTRILLRLLAPLPLLLLPGANRRAGRHDGRFRAMDEQSIDRMTTDVIARPLSRVTPPRTGSPSRAELVASTLMCTGR